MAAAAEAALAVVATASSISISTAIAIAKAIEVSEVAKGVKSPSPNWPAGKMSMSAWHGCALRFDYTSLWLLAVVDDRGVFPAALHLTSTGCPSDIDASRLLSAISRIWFIHCSN